MGIVLYQGRYGQWALYCARDNCYHCNGTKSSPKASRIACGDNSVLPAAIVGIGGGNIG